MVKQSKRVCMYIVRAENRLLNSLRQHQAEIIDQYGEVIEETQNTEPLGIESDLHWQVHTHTHTQKHTPSLLQKTAYVKITKNLEISLSVIVHYSK